MPCLSGKFDKLTQEETATNQEPTHTVLKQQTSAYHYYCCVAAALMNHCVGRDLTHVCVKVVRSPTKAFFVGGCVFVCLYVCQVIEAQSCNACEF